MAVVYSEHPVLCLACVYSRRTLPLSLPLPRSWYVELRPSRGAVFDRSCCVNHGTAIRRKHNSCHGPLSARQPTPPPAHCVGTAEIRSIWCHIIWRLLFWTVRNLKNLPGGASRPTFAFVFSPSPPWVYLLLRPYLFSPLAPPRRARAPTSPPPPPGRPAPRPARARPGFAARRGLAEYVRRVAALLPSPRPLRSASLFAALRPSSASSPSARRRPRPCARPRRASSPPRSLARECLCWGIGEVVGVTVGAWRVLKL